MIITRLHVFDHPLIQHKLTYITHPPTPTKEFTQLLHQLRILIPYQLTTHLQLQHVQIQTPLTKITPKPFPPKNLPILPILTPPLAMTDPVLTL
ncbi:uracil phosphoribosyltransferase, partial [Staphylococcus epidermidis]|uniref:uracil phosphoribosyltransferase n=1 Tax=Staphylococcus epidermidis TaxID=1282 RepID=UPI0037D9DAFE